MIYNKHIIIAGCARSGKTTLSRKLKKNGFIHYKMDSIKRGICKYHSIKTDNWTDYSKGVVTIIRQIIEDEKEDNIIFDTPHISPLDAEKLKKYAIIIFLGYPDMRQKEFRENTKKYDKNTWSSQLPLDEQKELFQSSKDFSIQNKKDCKKTEIPYFNVSKNRNKVLNKAKNYILSELERSKNEL